MSDQPDNINDTDDTTDDTDGIVKNLAERRSQMRYEWNNLIDDLIAEGEERGVFNDLPGKGKPLNLDRNLFAPELDLAHHLLKDNDLLPAWITDRNHLLEQVRTLRADLQRVWLRHQEEGRLPERHDALILSWYDACQAWEAQIADLNKQIRNFNLKRPGDNLELFILNLDDELRRVGAARQFVAKQ